MKGFKDTNFKGGEILALYNPEETNLEQALIDIPHHAEEKVFGGVNLLVISNKPVSGNGTGSFIINYWCYSSSLVKGRYKGKN